MRCPDHPFRTGVTGGIVLGSQHMGFCLLDTKKKKSVKVSFVTQHTLLTTQSQEEYSSEIADQ